MFKAQKSMYGGKRIAVGDVAYIFASENEGGCGLIGRGLIISVEALPKPPAVRRHTPRVSIGVKRTATAKCALGRRELRSFDDWRDGRPETELNFKFYRQATNKVAAISSEAAAFLDGYLENSTDG